MGLPLLGVTYRHYKRATEYCVIAIARHSETDESLVVYAALYSDAIFPYNQVWTRPAEPF